MAGKGAEESSAPFSIGVEAVAAENNAPRRRTRVGGRGQASPRHTRDQATRETGAPNIGDSI